MTWTAGAGVTVAHPAPATGGPSIVSQMKRTRFSSVVTTTNQVCGIGFNAAEDAFMWRGNAAGLGGFYVSFRFQLPNWTTGDRIFAGLSSSTTAVVASDTVAGDVIGLWHDASDLDTGSTRLNIVTRDNSTTTKTSIAASLVPNLQDALCFDFELFAKPNDTVVYWALYDVNSDVLANSGSVSTTLPRNTVFMGPQCAGSNAGNTTALDMQFNIVKIYGHSHY